MIKVKGIEKKLNAKILSKTMTIQKKYPELSKYLEEMPVTIPNKAHPKINIINLKAYDDSLNSLMENYVLGCNIYRNIYENKTKFKIKTINTMALKRHPVLQDYSREHHDELLLVWKIREGLKKGVSLKRIIDYCVRHYNEVTSLHMEKEEKYILKKLPKNDNDRMKILTEHASIKELMKKLSKNSSDKNKLLSEFADKLEKHIRYEERIFFPKLQNLFPDEIIKSMQPAESKIKECTVWKDPFWEKQSVK